MLARAYGALGRHGDVVVAHQKALELRGDDAGLLTDYADALGMTNGRSLRGEPAQLISRALTVDPEYPQGRRAGRHSGV